ncbi:MAG: hypothetical protein ACI85U_003953 [Candidatus Promineifilaceae bacterium]|jgi:hypothetical protein
MFKRIDPRFNLEALNFGSSNNRMLVIALIGADLKKDWIQIPESRILLIGGKVAAEELKAMIDSKNGGLSRGKLHKQLPGGMTSRTHGTLLRFVGM